MLGEAAHFIADCACALGRDTRWKTVLLFLLGLQKLNVVYDSFGSDAGSDSLHWPILRLKSPSRSCPYRSASFGSALISPTYMHHISKPVGGDNAPPST